MDGLDAGSRGIISRFWRSSSTNAFRSLLFLYNVFLCNLRRYSVNLGIPLIPWCL